jgi:hypothetical protein
MSFLSFLGVPGVLLGDVGGGGGATAASAVAVSVDDPDFVNGLVVDTIDGENIFGFTTAIEGAEG